jgi:hypothetical protein
VPPLASLVAIVQRVTRITKSAQEPCGLPRKFDFHGSWCPCGSCYPCNAGEPMPFPNLLNNNDGCA